jgi:hypothetical protein
MNKEQLEEALKVVREPITVNSIEYKYFDLDNYNKLVNVIEYCQYLQANVKPYVEAQDRKIEQLTNNWNELEEWLKSYIALIENPDTLEEQTLEDLKEVLDKMKEIKEGNNALHKD